MMNAKAPEGADGGTLEFTGERYQPEVDGPIAFEHLHRYHFAAGYAVGRVVLDVACGEGYGTDILAAVAQSATGLDISHEAVVHARAHYRRPGLDFVAGSAAELPFADNSFDLVVSFETIEHHDRHEEMISEIYRVLRPGGLLIISSPNKQHYSIEPNYHNPYHVKELFREELLELLNAAFSHVEVLGQRVVYGSVMVPVEPAAFQSLRLRSGDAGVQLSAGLARPHYDVVLASDEALHPPVASIFEMDVHGLDPATFYGVHLPQRVAAADLEVAQLRVEASARDALLEQVGPVFQARMEAFHDLQGQLRQELGGSRDERIQALTDLVAEKEVRLQAAAESKRQLDSWLSELQLHAKNLESRRAELESELSASSAHVTGLKAQLSEQGARLEDLLRMRDKAMTDADALARDRAVLQARCEALLRDLAERDLKWQVLTADIASRDARLQALADGLADRDARIQTLAAELSERDALLRDRAQEVVGLEMRVEEATLLLAQERDLLHGSRAHIEILEEQMRRVMTSRSWRYTAMFRRVMK